MLMLLREQTPTSYLDPTELFLLVLKIICNPLLLYAAFVLPLLWIIILLRLHE